MKEFMAQLLLCSVTMTAVAVIYCILSKLLYKIQSARWRFLPWTVITVGFIIPFRPRFSAPFFEINKQKVFEEVSHLNNQLSPVFSDRNISVGNDFSPDIWLLIFAVWLMGMIIFLSYVFVKQTMFYRSIKRLSRCADKNTVIMSEQLCSELKIKRHVSVRILPFISSPMLTGIFRPCILLPEQSFSSEELRLVLKHELTHLKHGDLFIKLLMVTAHAVHWFNPVLPFLMHFAEIECEFACDEDVMQSELHSSASVYCNSILKIAANSKNNGMFSPAVSTNFFSGKRNLKMRMHTIFSTNRKYSVKIIFIFMTALIISTGSLVAYSSDDNSETMSVYDEYDDIDETTDKTDNITAVTTTIQTLPENSATADIKENKSEEAIHVVTENFSTSEHPIVENFTEVTSTVIEPEVTKTVLTKVSGTRIITSYVSAGQSTTLTAKPILTDEPSVATITLETQLTILPDATTTTTEAIRVETGAGTIATTTLTECVTQPPDKIATTAASTTAVTVTETSLVTTFETTIYTSAETVITPEASLITTTAVHTTTTTVCSVTTTTTQTTVSGDSTTTEITITSETTAVSDTTLTEETTTSAVTSHSEQTTTITTVEVSETVKTTTEITDDLVNPQNSTKIKNNATEKSVALSLFEKNYLAVM